MSAVAFSNSSDGGTQNGDSGEDDYTTIRNLARDCPSDDDGSKLNGHGNYSSRMDEIFGGNGSDDSRSWWEDTVGQEAHDDNDEGDEEFLYTGKDAELPSGGYRERLKDVLENDELDSEDEAPDHGANTSDSIRQVNDFHEAHVYIAETPASEGSASVSSGHGPYTSPVRMGSPYSSSMPSRPFLHPSISRLRSSLPTQRQRVVSSSSLNTTHILGRDDLTPSPSHLSSISRTSSASNLRAGNSALKDEKGQEAFKWTNLRVIGEHVYHEASNKASAVLGSPVLGLPTVMAANGLICIGTDAGRVLVFDFKQELKCICGEDDSARSLGPVSALALSHDHTFVAVGHGQGYVQLFDIKHPLIAARTVVPTTLSAVRSGRREGHLLGSRIVSLGFISGRHTAFVSADDQGLSFFHSLGKVLFMDANDCLRLLGKYPEEELIPSPQPTKRLDPPDGLATPSTNGSATPRFVQQVHRKANTILSMGPLPLGTVKHPTDSYQLVAMLTPVKLVLVGLRPTPKTWYRRHREGEDGNNGRSRWRGCLAWFPSISVSENMLSATKARDKRQSAMHNATYPLLAFSWGSTLYILRVSESCVSQTVRNEKTGKIEKLDIRKVNFEDHGLLALQTDILAIQWLNLNQIILLTDATLAVFDIRASKIVENVFYDALNLVSPTLSYTSNGAVAYQDSVRDIHHSVRIYKGKIFLLEFKEVKVGTLLSWADRILAYVQEGDFLSAINLARDYYLGKAKGNKNGLPEEVDAMHDVVGEKMSDLMVASARYAFSEDRLTDSTHVTADNRGVDRTSLFEDLVSTCTRACIALDQFDFLFEDLFQYYDDAGISQIYLRQLEPFILNGAVHFIPPRITQRLVAMHDECGDYVAAERLIWHIDPDCLDINQALTLCQKYHVYDALIYIYNSALRDYITPIVELLSMARKVQQIRRERVRGATNPDSPGAYDAVNDETLVLNAYKNYPYLSNILSGLRYPSETPLFLEDALKAQTDIYSFLFHGRSSVWPAGGGGKLVLTTDEEGGVEPTYPYARLLLRFDAEAFLHVLDIAFEQSYLNDEMNGTSRQIIIKILLDIVSTSGPTLSPADVTFVNIFVARNVPKYPQFIHIAPSSLQNLLIGLASDVDQSTREDRQLAAEFLLSAYTPHDSEKIMRLFEAAGFYRILRSWYRQEGQWAALLRTYVHDPELQSDEVFQSVEQTLSQACRVNGKQLPGDVISSLQDSLPLLLQSGIPHTALLIDKYVPHMHSRVINDFQEADTHKQYAYLRCLLGPPPNGDESLGYTRENGPSTSVDSSLRKLYLKLLCQLEPSNVIVGLEYLPRDSLDVIEIASICEEARMYEAVVWLINEDSAVESLTRLEKFSRDLTVEVGNELLSLEGTSSISPDLEEHLAKFEALCRMGVDICREDSEQTAEADIPLEDLWFMLLSSQMDAVQAISPSISYGDGLSSCSPAEERVITTLRGLVQESFTSLVAVSSTKAVSFPRLFKRLVDSAARSHNQSGAKYAEFRNIITSMLESYRSEGDLLAMSKRIIDSDFFDTVEDLTKERSKGWASSSKCLSCKKQVNSDTPVRKDHPSPSQNSVVVSRIGVYHSTCFHADLDPA